MTNVRKSLIEQCAKLNIVVPERATKKQIETLIDDYYKTAAVITADEGLQFRQTNKPIAEYYIHFTVSRYLKIRAESEEAACKWVENDNLLENYSLPYEYVNTEMPEIIECHKAELDHSHCTN